MAVRLRTYVDSLNTVQYTVDIHDSNYTGVVVEFKCNNFSMEYNGEDKRYATLNAASAQLNMLVEESNSAALESFIDDLVLAEENQFRIVIYDFSTKIFIGVILNDAINIEDAFYPYDFQIIATDSLGRLKDFPYNDNGQPYAGRATFIDHICNCLEQTGLKDLFDTNDDYLRTSVNWMEQNHATGVDPLLYTDVAHEVFYSVDNKGNISYQSCHSVLTQLLQIFGAQLKQSFGAWQINQPNELADMLQKLHIYRKDKSLKTSTDIANFDLVITNPTKQRLTGASYSFFPGLRNVTINYKHEATRNIVPGIVWRTGVETEYNVGEFQFTAPGAAIAFRAKLNYNIDFDINQGNTSLGYFAVWKMKLNHGDHWLQRDYEIVGVGVAYVADIQWSVGTEAYCYFKTPLIVPGEEDGNEERQFNAKGTINMAFQTPLYEAIGDFVTKLEFVGVYGVNQTQYLSPEAVLTYEVVNPYMEIVDSEGEAAQSDVRTYSVSNSAAPGNSVSIKLDTIIGDGPNVFSPGKLRVSNDGITWVDSSAWSVGGSGDTYLIQQLLIREIMSGQKTAVRKLQGGWITSNFRARDVIVYDNYRWVFIRGSFDARMDEWRGTWYVVGVDRTNINTGNVADLEAGIGSPSQGYTPNTDPVDNTGTVTNTGGVNQTNPNVDNNFEGDILIQGRRVLTLLPVKNIDIGDSHAGHLINLPEGVDGFEVDIILVDTVTGDQGHGVYDRTSSSVTISGTGAERNVNALLSI